jgi:hypothetical protein
MSDRRDDRQAGGDPEDRAFTGDSDGPPREPDQPADGNEELERSTRGREAKPDKQSNPHGDYPDLPGYGG